MSFFLTTLLEWGQSWFFFCRNAIINTQDKGGQALQNPFGNGNGNGNGDWKNQEDMMKNMPLPPNYARIKNDEDDYRIAKVGISWTTFWFGPFPALFRGDIYNFILMLVLDADYVLVALVFHWNFLLQIPLMSLVYTFFYNMMYFRHLFNKGYYPADQQSKETLIKARYWKE